MPPNKKTLAYYSQRPICSEALEPRVAAIHDFNELLHDNLEAVGRTAHALCSH